MWRSIVKKLVLFLGLSWNNYYFSMATTLSNETTDDDGSFFYYPTQVLTSKEADNDDDIHGIVWDHVGYTTAGAGAVILEPFSFHVGHGRVCAILGPSGAGKTTLLKSLASATKHDGQVYLYYTERRRGGHGSNNEDTPTATHPTSSSTTTLYLSPLARHVNQVAWLQQTDNFFSLLTVQETLELAAYLELPELSKGQRLTMISNLMDGLGLQYDKGGNGNGRTTNGGGEDRHENNSTTTCRPTHLLSGGERRRLSVALELLSSEEVKVLLADEPTSGLDASRSEKVLRLIQTLAHTRNIPCLVTLHQPRSSIWNNLLDDCILMAHGGRVCYAGPTDACLDYFENLGYSCPPATNPAEFVIDLVSVDTEDPVQEHQDRLRIERLATAFRQQQRNDQNEQQQRLKNRRVSIVMEHPQDNILAFSRRPRGLLFRWIPRFAALVRRSWRQNIRSHAVNAFRLVASAGNAALLAQIFPTVRGSVATANSVADRVALLSFGAINMCMLAFIKTVELFGKEKPVVQREQRRQQYTALEYLLAKGLAELPLDVFFACVFTTVLKWASGIRISWARLTSVFSLMTAAGASLGFLLGSWAPTAQLAQQAGIPLLVILMVIGIINPSGVDPSVSPPLFLQAIKLLSPFAYCIEALCLGEYPGMEFARKGWLGRVKNLPRLGGLAFVKNGDQVIEALGLNGKTFEGSMKQLAMLTAANFLMSWVGMLVHQHFESPRHFEPQARKRKPSSASQAMPDPIAVAVKGRF